MSTTRNKNHSYHSTNLFSLDQGKRRTFLQLCTHKMSKMIFPNPQAEMMQNTTKRRIALMKSRLVFLQLKAVCHHKGLGLEVIPSKQKIFDSF